MEHDTIRASISLKRPLFGIFRAPVRSYLIVLLPVVLLLVCAPWVYGNPGYVNATELTGRVVRSGIPDVTVNLLGPDNVGMDVTATNRDGLYTIDLGVLEDKELANLAGFSLQVEEKGKSKKRIRLGDGLNLKGTVIWFKDIKLP